MRSKKRQTNLVIMQQELEKLELDEKKDPEVGREVIPIVKPKGVRGPPKMPLINTQKLLTG